MLSAAALMVASCREPEKLMFDSKATVCFRMPTKEQDELLVIQDDTITYSFVDSEMTTTHYTINIPVEIADYRRETDRYYRVEAVAEGTTATAGVHYEALADRYVIPAGEGSVLLPLKVNRTDDLRESEVKVQLRIVATEDFGIGIAERQNVWVKFSDMLEEPSWWPGWQNIMGTYSRVKYQYWREVFWGKEPLSDSGFRSVIENPLECLAIEKMRLFFDENVVLDENNARVLVPIY